MRSMPWRPMAINRRAAVSHLRLVLAAVRIVAAVGLVVLVIKIAPTLADHAASHSGTYASVAASAAQGAVAVAPRAH